MISELLDPCSALALKAGSAALEFYGKKDLEVHAKSDKSPVTAADLAAHHILVDGLQELPGDFPIISEESGVPSFAERSAWKRFWLVDPLDGTKEFIKGNGEFTVNIALIDNGEPVLGVVYAPATGALYRAGKGLGAFKRDGENYVRIVSTPMKTPESAVVSRSHPSGQLAAFLDKHGVSRRVPAGSSLKFCLVAEGAADVYPRFGPTMEWDTAAGDCVYRDSAASGRHPCALNYNKPDLRNGGFIVGMQDGDAALAEFS
jgi:3'(2'), 5'-bisphosphate nucleotidase